MSIPVAQLGYMPPGDLPAFYYQALVELHFLDANHLLFVFNIPGLLRRDNNCPTSDSQRMVRAVVLEIPSGHVLKQADWELYDFMDYLWGLGNGQLLLRRCAQLDIVGADLQLQPWIDASGAIEHVSFSPDRSVVVVEEKVTPDAGAQDSGTVPSILEQGTLAPRTEVDFIRVHPLQVLVRAKIPLPGVIPITAQGIFETLAAPHERWVVNMQPFAGGQQEVTTIHSFCQPDITAVSNQVFVAMTCPSPREMAYQGYGIQGRLLWQMPFRSDRLVPQFILTRDGTHFAIETLQLTHPHAGLDPLTSEDVDGENIDIYDTLSGVRTAGFQITPIYTAGHNVDFSPDGTRIAVLHNGAIEIYTLSELVKAQQAASR